MKITSLKDILNIRRWLTGYQSLCVSFGGGGGCGVNSNFFDSDQSIDSNRLYFLLKQVVFVCSLNFYSSWNWSNNGVLDTVIKFTMKSSIVWLHISFILKLLQSHLVNHKYNQCSMGSNNWSNVFLLDSIPCFKPLVEHCPICPCFSLRSYIRMQYI